MTTVRALATLAKESLVYGVSGMLLRFMSAFLVPVYTRAFSPAEYGSLSIVLSTVALLGVFVVLALDNSSARWYYDTDDESDRKTTFSTWAWTYLTAASAAGVVLFLSAPWLSEWLLESSGQQELFESAALTLPAGVLGQVLFMWLRVQRRAWAAVGYTILTGSITVATTLVLIVGLDRGVSGVFQAQVLAGVGGSLVAVALMRDWIRPRWFQRDRLSEMLRYGLPLVPAALGFWVINISDRYLLRFLASQAEVGLYQVAYSVAAITYLVTAAFQMAWGPFAFSIHKEPHARDVYAKTFLAYGWLATVVAAATAMLTPEVLRIIATPSYAAARDAVPLLVFGYVLLGAYQIAGIGPGIIKTTKPVAAGIAIAAGINVVLNFTLIPPFGIVGAGIATLLSYLVMASYLFARSQKLYPISYRFIPVIAFGGVSLAVALVVGRWEPDHVWVGVLVKLGILALSIPAAFAFRFVRLAEVRQALVRVRSSRNLRE